MRNAILFGIITLLGAGTVMASEEPDSVTISWYGQACFLITTSDGTQILTDPINMKDYRIPEDVTPAIVTVSHNHRDHNAVDAVSGEPLVIYGKTRDEADHEQSVIPIDTTISDVRIYTVESNHFPPDHSPSLNAIFVFEFDGVRLAHLGDLGMTLSEDQIEKIGKIDILMIPVGGKYTISGAMADTVVSQLQVSRVVVPMHFRTRVADFLPLTADDFVKDKPNIERVAGHGYHMILSDTVEELRYVVFDCYAGADSN